MSRIPMKPKLLLAISVVIAAIAAGSLYFLFLSPKLDELERKEAELKTEQQLLAAVENNAASRQANSFSSTVELQKRVPVKPLIEQLLLDIEKAEVVSGSFVAEMQFEEGEVAADTPLEEDVQSAEAQASVAASDETVPVALPQGVRKITVALTARSSTYYEFERFIESLENNKRIILVESIEFEGQEEMSTVENDSQALNYNIAVSAFYMPELAELEKQLPAIDSPPPGNKRNPLNSFADVKVKKSSEEEGDL
ncbi:pilus assembly protein PilO [Bacillus infantis]|uniref:pilus assembly protein PilO n=1 Tax=Bacillus infantis TaxID=324767 RepID=UPI003CF5F8DC